jgi:hypothetical protein
MGKGASARAERAEHSGAFRNLPISEGRRHERESDGSGIWRCVSVPSKAPFLISPLH